jgi:hypothetical protein
MRPRLKAAIDAAGGLPCVNRCRLGGVVLPGQAFDVAHIIDVDAGGTDDPSNLGAAHVACNRSDGGKAGRAKQLTRARDEKRLMKW